MKKNLFLIILFFSLFIIREVKAEDITFSDVVNKMKESDFYDLTGTDDEAMQLTSSEDSITINYSSEGNDFVTIFTHDAGIISYSFDQDKTDQNKTAMKSFSDSMILLSIVAAIKELKNVSDNDYQVWSEQLDYSNFSLASDGIEFNNIFEYSIGSEGVSMSGEWADSIKIDINNMNFVVENSDANLIDNNPKTNISSPIIVFGGLAILAIIITVYIKKKKIFVNI